MADTFVFSNFAVGALQSAVDQFATTLRIASDDAAKLPTLSGGAKAPIVLADTKDNVEVCYITAWNVSGELTVERAREGTAARSWSAGTQVEHCFTAASFLAAAKVNPRGVWSAVVNYVAGDVVEHNDVSYLAVQPSLNQIPSSGSAFWQTFFVPPGVSASALSWQGVWNSGTTYALGALVHWRGRLAVSLQAANLNHLPSDAAWWSPITVGPGEVKHFPVLTAAGTNNYTVTPAPAITELFDGAELTIVFANTNSAAATLQVNAIAPVPLRPKRGVEFAADEVVPNEPYKFVYFSATNELVAINTPSVSEKIDDLAERVAIVEAYLKYVPVGTVVDFAGAAAPPGWLLCFGQVLSRATYAALFAVIGTIYNTGGEAGTDFRLPDCKGRTTFGVDNMGGVAAGRLTAAISGVAGNTLGATGGSEALHAHAHGINDLGHGHSVNNPPHTHGDAVPISFQPVDSGSNFSVPTGIGTQASGSTATAITVNNNTTGITIQSFGAGGSQNVPPAIVFNKMIFTGVA